MPAVAATEASLEKKASDATDCEKDWLNEQGHCPVAAV
jgi:hypothetical protein